jgi:hypothetical protein
MAFTRRVAALFVSAAFLATIDHALAQEQPWDTSSIELETGLLWQVGNNTPLSYRLIPFRAAWRSREVFRLELSNGARLLLRHRFSVFGTWIQQGPESHYLAFDASPSIELWNRAGTHALVGGAGGGFGWLDSQSTVGGQGQDFTLNWFARIGVERMLTPRRSVSLSLVYQHLSNGGRTDPNPGIDAVGFSLGYSWSR